MHQRIERFGFYYGFPVFFMTTKDRATGADDLTPLSSSWTLGNTMVIDNAHNAYLSAIINTLLCLIVIN